MTRASRWWSAALALVLPSTALAVTFQFQDPELGGHYDYRFLPDDVDERGWTLGPDFVKYVSPGNDGVAGYELERTDQAATFGGWAFKAFDAGQQARAESSARLLIVPDPGEEGQEIQFFVHMKAFIEGTGDVSLVVDEVPGPSVGIRVDKSDPPGWYRPAPVPVVVTLPAVIDVDAVMVTTDTGIADGRVQVSFSSTPPGDPPIAGPQVPIPGFAIGVSGIALAAVGLARARAQARRSARSRT